MQQANLESFLKTGTILAVLSIDGKGFDEKERLNTSASCLETSLFWILILKTTLFWILNGPPALLVLRKDLLLAISSLSADLINIKLLHWCFQKSVYKDSVCSHTNSS